MIVEEQQTQQQQMFHPRQNVVVRDDRDMSDMESAGHGEDSIISSENFAGDDQDFEDDRAVEQRK